MIMYIVLVLVLVPAEKIDIRVRDTRISPPVRCGKGAIYTTRRDAHTRIITSTLVCVLLVVRVILRTRISVHI